MVGINDSRRHRGGQPEWWTIRRVAAAIRRRQETPPAGSRRRGARRARLELPVVLRRDSNLSERPPRRGRDVVSPRGSSEGGFAATRRPRRGYSVETSAARYREHDKEARRRVVRAHLRLGKHVESIKQLEQKEGKDITDVYGRAPVTARYRSGLSGTASGTGHTAGRRRDRKLGSSTTPRENRLVRDASTAGTASTRRFY